MSKKTKFGFGEPVLSRKRRAPTRLDQNSSNIFYYDESPKDMYQRVYYEIVDKLKGEIKCRYSSPAFALYTNVELINRSCQWWCWHNLVICTTAEPLNILHKNKCFQIYIFSHH